jgi:hypothetical protein
VNSDINHNSSSFQSTSTYIKCTGNLGDKLEHAFSIPSELVEALMSDGCSKCIAIRDVIKKHNSTEIVHESYTRPIIAEIKRVRRQGRPRIGLGIRTGDK